MAVVQDLGVQTRHPEYDKALPNWQKVDDVINSDVKKYLRNIGKNEEDPTYAAQRQEEYEEGAILHNFTLNTRNGMQGAIFMRPPVIDLPPKIADIIINADGNNMSLSQQAQSAVDQVLRKGRLGLLADMPSVPPLEDGEKRVLSKAEVESITMMPRIQMYPAQSIINWSTTKVGSINKLSLVVLMEEYDDPALSSIFAIKTAVQYRVLAMDENGNYYQQVYREVSVKAHEDRKFNASEPVYGRQNGSLMTDIPFYFIGSEDNDHNVDTQPLLPMAILNIGHYRNSADTEENSFLCGQAMLTLNLTGMDISDFNKSNPDGVRIGSRRGLIATDAKFIQAEESDKAMKLMDIKEKQAVQIGAQLISESKVITAESARIQQGANASALSSVSSNVTDGYRRALAQCARYLAVDPDKIEFSLNKEFFFTTLTAQDKAQWVSEIMSGISPKALYYQKLRDAGEYPDDWTDVKIRAAIEADGTGGFEVTEIKKEDLPDEE